MPPSNTPPLGRERVSHCSVDSRGSCTRVLVVVATNSSASVASPHRLLHLLPRPSTHRQLSAHRPARLHAVSARVVLSVTSGQLHLRISSRRPKFVSGHRCSSARAASSPHVHAVGSKTAPSSRSCTVLLSVSSSAVLLSPCSMIVTFLSSATSPCQCWTIAPLLKMFALRCVLRLKDLSSNQPGSRRASHACTKSAIILLLAQQPVVPQLGPLFVCFVCGNIITTLCTVRFHPVRWYPQPLVEILIARYVSAPRRAPQARLTHERFDGDTVRARNHSDLIPRARKIEFESCKKENTVRF